MGPSLGDEPASKPGSGVLGMFSIVHGTLVPVAWAVLSPTVHVICPFRSKGARNTPSWRPGSNRVGGLIEPPGESWFPTPRSTETGTEFLFS
jgi:hypothetical protein